MWQNYIDTMFGANLINSRRAMDDYLYVKRPTCHVYRINRLWNNLKIEQYAYKFTITVQTLEIALTTIESRSKNQTL